MSVDKRRDNTYQDRRAAMKAATPIVNEAETTLTLSLDSLALRVTNLETFRDRAAGFAAASHNHNGADITAGTVAAARIGAHDNNQHLATYLTAATANTLYAPLNHDNNNHIVAFLTRATADTLYAPTPHNDAHHTGSGI